MVLVTLIIIVLFLLVSLLVPFLVGIIVGAAVQAVRGNEKAPRSIVTCFIIAIVSIWMADDSVLLRWMVNHWEWNLGVLFAGTAAGLYCFIPDRAKETVRPS